MFDAKSLLDSFLGQGQTDRVGAPGEAGGMAEARSAADLIAQAREAATTAPGVATASLGGTTAAIFGAGAGAGRSLATNIAKLGGLAMIGALAYRAWQNHLQGKPTSATRPDFTVAPPGSGFEEDAAGEGEALLFVRAMIAAAAADGSVNPRERRAIMVGVSQAGFGANADRWLEAEIDHPASAEQLAAATGTSARTRAKLYAAARLAIDLDGAAGSAFLSRLARALELDPSLVAEIDASAAAARAGA